MTDLPVRPLHTEADYQAALVQFETFFDHEPAPGSEASDRFELLGLVIAKYEDDHFAIDDADPVEVLKLVMDGRGLEQKDLAEVLGSAPRASEILNRKRDLNLDQIRRIARAWSIPADALIGVVEHA